VKNQHRLDPGGIAVKNEGQVAGDCYSPKRNQPLHAEGGKDEAGCEKSQPVDAGHIRAFFGYSILID
jgi:hypothetical protein